MTKEQMDFCGVHTVGSLNGSGVCVRACLVFFYLMTVQFRHIERNLLVNDC